MLIGVNQCLILRINSMGKSGGIYEIFNLKLFVAKFLFEPILLADDGAVLVEDAVVGTAKINGENQNRCTPQNHKEESKNHITLFFPLLQHK